MDFNVKSRNGMFYKRVIQIALIFFTPYISWAQTPAAKIEALLQEKMPHAITAIMVKDAETGRIVYQRKPDKLLSPASNMKLFIAAAALYHFSPNHHFTTSLAQKDRDYYLTFTGAPSFTRNDLYSLLSHLKSDTNVLTGDIILDTSYIKPPFYPAGTSYDDLGWYYAAPDTAVIIDGNMAKFHATTAEKTGQLIHIKPRGNLTPVLKVINDVKTVSAMEAKNHCDLNIKLEDHNTLKLYGCMAQVNYTKLLQLAIPDPVLMAKQLIKQYLLDQGLVLEGNIKVGQTPADATLKAQVESSSLIELITHMLRESDNLYASSLSKQLAHAITGEGSYKQAVFAMKKVLKSHTHLNWSQIDLGDAVGTRYNQVTTSQVVTLLNDIYHDKQLKSMFIKALPQAGISGTLQDRMKDSKLFKRVFAKTGTMHDISSLSGYMVYPNGKTLIFSLITNGIDIPIYKVRLVEEEVLKHIDEMGASPD